MKLSVILVVRNEEANIVYCLQSIKAIADEIIIFDENSTDKTAEIAKLFGAKVFKVNHETNFHINKQKATSEAHGDWILYLDADERVSSKLADEIRGVTKSKYKSRLETNKLFLRHQKILEQNIGKIGTDSGEVVAYFIPRRNYFLGKPLIHAGVYPDGVIRLVKKGKGIWPAKSVHETMQIDGKVGWLYNDLEHHDSPTFSRYLTRLNRYTDLQAEEFKKAGLPHNSLFLLHYSFIKPFINFVILYFRHKGFLDGFRGFVWSLFSSLHFPIAYFKYWQMIER